MEGEINSQPEQVAAETPVSTEKSASPKPNVEKKSFPGVNLYVKNLDDSFTDEKLREVFKKFGAIISTKMMFDGPHPKGFGFVCFSTQEEAQAAVTHMNGRIVGTKPLYVTYAQRKEDRKAFLEKKYKEMGTTAPTVPPMIPTPVKSPTLLPPTTPPTPTYYQMPTSPHNIHYQYFPAGHNVIQQPIPWNPVNMQGAIPVQMANQFSSQPQFTTMPMAAPNYENGSTIMQSPPFMWTNTAAPNGPFPYAMQQSNSQTYGQASSQGMGNAAVPSNNINYLSYQQQAHHPNYPGNPQVTTQQQFSQHQMPNNLIAMQSVPKTIEHQQSNNAYHIQPQ